MVEQEAVAKLKILNPSHEKFYFLPMENTMQGLGSVMCNNAVSNNLTTLKAFNCNNKYLSHIHYL